MRTTDTHVLFWRTADIYSNWHPSPFVRNGIAYANAEQYMMAAKARLFGDAAVEAKIMATRGSDPNTMKALGREVRGYVEAVWVAHRDWVMFAACLAKFAQDPVLRAELLATEERELVEASPVDRIWGIGLGEDDTRALDKSQWRGLNLLGIALMRVRDTLRALDEVLITPKLAAQREIWESGG